MTNLTDFLFPSPARRSVTGILQWWEGRRLQYNLLVGASGVLSLALVRIFTWMPPNHLAFPIPFGVVIAFGVAANICYTFGPAIEIAAEKAWGRKALPIGPTLFRMGLTFSLGLTQLPTLIAGFSWAVRVLTAIF